MSVHSGAIHLRAEISGQAKISGPGPKFWPGKNEPKILAWNSRPEFQAEISGQNSRPEFRAEISGQNSKPEFQWAYLASYKNDFKSATTSVISA